MIIANINIMDKCTELLALKSRNLRGMKLLFYFISLAALIN